MHDFNPGITPNGVFWIVQVPDSAVQISGDSITLNLENVAVVDQYHFPGGTGHKPVTLSFQATYVRTGTPRLVTPKSRDPLSPFNWAGQMWMATNSGTFSLAYNDGTFSAQGSFSSMGNFGEMGTERNGSFVQEEDLSALSALPAENNALQGLAETHEKSSEQQLASDTPRLKGRIPLTSFLGLPSLR